MYDDGNASFMTNVVHEKDEPFINAAWVFFELGFLEVTE
jgi:hypothetical protein